MKTIKPRNDKDAIQEGSDDCLKDIESTRAQTGDTLKLSTNEVAPGEKAAIEKRIEIYSRYSRGLKIKYNKANEADRNEYIKQLQLYEDNLAEWKAAGFEVSELSDDWEGYEAYYQLRLPGQKDIHDGIRIGEKNFTHNYIAPISCFDEETDNQTESGKLGHILRKVDALKARAIEQGESKQAMLLDIASRLDRRPEIELMLYFLEEVADKPNI